jgi:hypothetical protein
MSKTSRLILCLIPLWLAALSPLAGFAADEDMVSQVYLEFDPETGEFKTAQDPSLSNSSQHQQGQQQQIQQIQQRQDQLGATGSQPATAAAPVGQGGTAASTDGGDAAPGASNSTLWAGGILVIGLLGGAVLLVRKNQQKTAS